jgi:iron(III) transport system permease protein
VTELASAAGRVLPRRVPLAASFGWQRVVLVLLVAFLVYQVVVPLAMIVWTSLKVARPGDPGFSSFTFTVANYLRAFGSVSFWTATWNTLLFALASTLLSFAIGAFVAWVIERTNTPLARLIGFMLIGRIVLPGILIAVSWILIASPNIGIVNQVVLKWLGVRNIVNI